MITGIIINPGAGPVIGANEDDAAENMRHFLVDCKQAGLQFIRVPALDYDDMECGEGRYAFLVWRGERCHEIQMPGLPLEKVRFVGSPGQSAWDFPRLYVDGNSWLWKFAILDTNESWEIYPSSEQSHV